jgi:beta-galactosidase
VTGARNTRGEHLRFVHNWSWTPSAFTLPCGATDVVTGTSFPAGATIELRSWDVRVLREDEGAPATDERHG